MTKVWTIILTQLVGRVTVPEAGGVQAAEKSEKRCVDGDVKEDARMIMSRKRVIRSLERAESMIELVENPEAPDGKP